MKRKIIFVLCAFLMNAALVLWLVREPLMEILADRNNPALKQIKNALSNISVPAFSLPSLPKNLPLPDLTSRTRENTDKPHFTPSEFNQQNSVRQTRTGGVLCSDALLGQPTHGGPPVYRWEDKAGITHLSDQLPTLNSIAVTTLNVFPADRFHLQLSGDLPHTRSLDNLKLTLYDILDEYAAIMATGTLRDVSLDLTFFSSRTAFEAEKAKWTDSAVHGVYSSDQSRALVFQADKDGWPYTAVHESVHAINDHFFGIMPRWLNEGLAQTFAQQTNGMRFTAPESRALQTLFFANNKDWDGGQRQWLYRQSKALTGYLMQSDKGRQFVAALLYLEMSAPCSALPPEHVQRLFSQSSLLRQTND